MLIIGLLILGLLTLPPIFHAYGEPLGQQEQKVSDNSEPTYVEPFVQAILSVPQKQITSVKGPVAVLAVSQDSCLDTLYSIESNWKEGRLNKSSFACGIPQALPCTKIYPYATKEWIGGVKNPDGSWKSPPHLVERDGNWYLPNPNREIEIAWGKSYIESRYGSACNALKFEKENGWY